MQAEQRPRTSFVSECVVRQLTKNLVLTCAMASSVEPAAPPMSQKDRIALATAEASKHAVYVNKLNFSHGDNHVLKDGERCSLT